MKKIIILFLLALLPLFVYAECPKITGKYDIHVNFNALQYNNEHSSEYISNLSKRDYEENTFSLGIFTGKKFFEIKPQIAMLESNMQGMKTYCAKYNHLDIVINFNPIIYIAKEIKKSSCTYNSVLEHENKHYNIELNALKDEIVLSNLSSIINEGLVLNFEGKNEDEISEKVNLNLQEISKAISIKFNENVTSFHAKLDTKENYEKEANDYSLEIKKLIEKLKK